MSLVFFGFFIAPASACSIPVFRYALENWQPDPYVAYVLHSGELTAEQQELIETLRSQDREGDTSANLIVDTINLDAEPGEFATQLRKENASLTLPSIVVQTPEKRTAPVTVFAGDFSPINVARLISSPMRTDIKDRLLNGDSVVWVYLECGIQEKDDEAFSMLTQELSRLQDELKLPEIQEEDLADLATSPESLSIRFSAVRLSRDDAQETALRDMLLHVEPDLLDDDYISQPMAFPIFGRGRALYALVGDGVAPDLISEACQFLTGACQCTVKAENPGVDILMQVDWDLFIQPTEAIDDSLPPLAGFSGFGENTESHHDEIQLTQNTVSDEVENSALSSSVSEPDGESPQATTDVTSVDAVRNTDETTSSASAVWQNVFYVMLLAGGAVFIATLFLSRRTGA